MVEKNNTTFLLAKSSSDEPSLHRSELLPAKRQVGVCLKGRGESALGGGGGESRVLGLVLPLSQMSWVTGIQSLIKNILLDYMVFTKV